LAEFFYGHMPLLAPTTVIGSGPSLCLIDLKNDKELYLVFVDLEKAFDRVPKVLIESALRRKGVWGVM